MIKVRNYKVLGMLALPVAALAVAALLISMNFGTQSAKADQPHSGVEFHVEAIAAGGASCTSAPDGKGTCTVAEGSSFVVTGVLDSFGTLPNYDGPTVTLDYIGVTSKDDADANVWAPCVFEATNFGAGTVTAGCAIGISAASSVLLGPVFTNTFNCAADGTITMIHSLSNTALTDSGLQNHAEEGPDSLNIDCVPATATSTATPTATPPPIPRMFKAPVLQNVFLTRQGEKIPPSRCEDGNNVATLTEQIGQEVVTLNPKGEAQDTAAFSFEVRFDPNKVCVNLAPAGPWATDPSVICTVRDKDSSTLDGIAQIGCISVGKNNDTDGLILATISVRPQPELYSQLRPNQDNGNVVQILDQKCKLSDEQGHAIPLFSCEDADITFRYLEGDVAGPDCSVDVFDAQNVSFRWGVSKNSLLYNSFMDLEPSGQVKGDGDIDINDIQFVFGRYNSTCSEPWPAQVPINSKA